MIFFILKVIVGYEPDMVCFVDNAFLRAQCLRSILQHVSPLAVGT